jgi:signal transduction histidine kinase/ligand-binding sensor domain-containing protein
MEENPSKGDCSCFLRDCCILVIQTIPVLQRLPLILVLLASLVDMQAQTPLYQHIGLSEGLMSHAVYSTFQDRDGYIWFGTDEGACRYDGLTFKYFTTDNGLCDNEVLQIKQDSHGRIWLLTLSGCLCYYKDGQMYNAENEPSLSHTERTIGFTGIAEDKQGRVLIFGLSNSVLIYDGQSIQSMHFFPEDQVLPTITFAFWSKEGYLCFMNQGHVFEMQGDSLIDTARTRMKYSRPNCVTYTPYGAVVITLDGLQLFDNSGSEVFAKPSCFSTWDQFMAINYFGDSFWFCLLDGGIEEWKYENKEWRLVATYLPGAIVNSVTQDAEKNLWFSTRDQGVYFLARHSFGQSFYEKEIPYQVSALVELPNEVYLVGTDHGEIYKIARDRNFAMELYAKPLKKVGLENMLLTDDGRVLCINHQGIYWVESGRLTAIDDSLNDEIPKTMILDDKGGAYVTGLIHCIHIPDINKPSKWYVLRGIPNDRIYHLAVDLDGVLWFEQHDKLYCYKGGDVRPHEAFNLMSKGRISDIQRGKNGRIVVATYGSGVFVLDHERIDMHFDSNNGLNSNECKYILCDGDNLYLHTSAGLWLTDCGTNGDHQPHLIKAFDNLANKKLLAMLIGKDRYFFGTYTGLYTAPKKVEAVLEGPRNVVIETINGVPIPNLDYGFYRYDYGQHVSMRFTALCYGWTKDLQFEYRNVTRDSMWVRAGSRVVNFSALPWGTNVIQIRTRHPHADWTTPKSITILVEAPFYASWWFRTIAFILSLAIVYLVVRVFLNRRFRAQVDLMEREKMLLTERNRISADLHDELGAEVSNIVILSRIAQAKIKNNDSPVSSIDKIDRAANDMINKMNGIIWSLNPANDDLTSLVEYLKRYANDYFELHDYKGGLELNGKLRKVQVKGIIRRNIFLILKEALHNVHKHAKANEVKVKIEVDARYLILVITDNGKGFDLNQKQRGRLGLMSLRRRAQDVGGEIEIDSKLDQGTVIKAKFTIS